MKTLCSIFLGLLLVLFCGIGNKKAVAQDKSTPESNIIIVSSPDLYSLTSTWALDFMKLNPNTKIEVLNNQESQSQKNLTSNADFEFISNGNFKELKNRDLWKINIGNDVLVPVINSNNPILAELKKQIITPEILSQVLKAPGSRVWNLVTKEGKTVAINYYALNDESTKLMIGKYLSTKRTIQSTDVINDKNLISAIQNDPFAIGFCKLSSLISSKNTENISIMPFDRNGNNQIDEFENIYCDMEAYLSKSCPGEFPKELTESIYCIAAEKPMKEANIEFLKFISTDGQKRLDQKGYFSLNYIEKQSNLNELGYFKEIKSSNEFFTIFSLRNAIIFIALLLVFVVMYLTEPFKKKAITNLTTKTPKALTNNSITVPTGLHFDKSHTWAFMEKNGLVGIGIDDFLQHIVGEITKIKMNPVGTKIKKGDPMVSIIQEGKQLIIKSPISGTIKSQNEELFIDSSLLNISPFDKGWIYKIEPANWLVEIQFLYMSKKYQEWLKNEFKRLKDFFANIENREMKEYALVLQDGGEIKDGILTEMSPEVWEDFQIHFIDNDSINNEK